MATKPPDSTRPTSSDPACHAATATSAAATAAVTPHFSQSNRGRTRHVLPQQQRRLDVPHLEQRHQREQHRHQQADREALDDGGQRQPVLDVAAARSGRRRTTAAAAMHAGGERDAERAAGQAEQQDLRHVDAEHLRRRAADALQDGDAADLLLRRRRASRSRRRCRRGSARPDRPGSGSSRRAPGSRPSVFVRRYAADADELVRRTLRAESRRHLVRSRGGLGHPQQQLVRRAAAERQQARRRRSAWSIITRGPSVKAPMRRPGSASMTPRISNGSRADQRSIADLETELRQQLGPHQRAAPCSSSCE